MTDFKRRNIYTIILIFSLVFTVTLGVETSYAFTSADADAAMNKFDTAFYTGSGSNTYFKNDTTGGGPDFWKNAEMIEVAEDAYDRTGNSTYRTMIDNLYNGFCYYFGTNWTGNIYNDDIMWMVLVCIRAYQITGNSTYLNQAKTHFDQVYTRAYDTALGGGLWWTTTKGEKNSCINCPAMIAACKLYQILGDSSYLSKAQGLYSWQTSKLWDNTTGAVYDNIKSDGTVNKGTTTYNQGTFIGASNLLYKITGTQSYYNNALKVLDYTKNNMTTNSILRSESGTADTGGFKGIFCRYALRFTKDNNITSYNSWFQLNANTAWSHRDSRGLMDQNWSVQTGSGTLQSWWCSAAVALLQTCPPDVVSSPTPTPRVTTTPTPRVTPTPTPRPAVTVGLSSYFNQDGFSYDTNRRNGNLDGLGYSYSADLINTTPTYNNISYQLGPMTDGSNNVIKGAGQTIILPQGTYSAIWFLGTATNNDQAGTFRINYTDGTYSTKSLTEKDWCTGSASGQNVVQVLAHRHSSSADQTLNNYMFAYSLTPTVGKTVTGIVLPNNNSIHVYAVALLP